MIKYIKKLFFVIENYLFGNICSHDDHRRLVCFLFLTLIETIVIPSYLSGRGGREGFLYTLPLLFQTLMFIVCEVGVWIKKINIKIGLGMLLGTIYLRLIYEVLLYSVFITTDSTPQLIGNFVMCIAATLFVIVTKLRYTFLSMCIVTDIVFCVCLLSCRNMEMWDTIWYFGIVYIALTMVCVLYFKQLGHEQKWDSNVRGMGREELKAIDLLSTNSELEIAKTQSLMERLHPERRDHIINNVSEYLLNEARGLDRIQALSPDLTASETEIIQLVLEGKTLKEICIALNKTETNISSQRSHIRKKLNMQREENFRAGLWQRLREE